jgi:DNA ligase-1
MKTFSQLLERLVFTPSRNAKLALLSDYFARTPDPDRGYALAALTGGLSFKNAKAGVIRELVSARVDPVLFGWSYDYVGDLAETAALIWPEARRANRLPGLSEIVEQLQDAKRAEVPKLLEGWLDSLGAEERFALLKLITGGLRVGVSARLTKTALAELGGRDVAEVEEVWHGLSPPYGALFAWLEGRGPRPQIDPRAAFRPMMLANPVEEVDFARMAAGDYRAEWKWDGIRVQLSCGPRGAHLFSRTGEDIGGAFPEILEAALGHDVVLDGELLVLREEEGEVAPFNDLQQRLNRKSVTKKLLEQHPAHVRAYDILFEGKEDLRGLTFDQRRARLEGWHRKATPRRLDISPLIGFADWEELAALREGARDNAIEGLMLKRGDSVYAAGRPKGPWFKWKRDTLTADAVLLYAQRGHGKRSSFYSDYTFGVWRGEELVPVGKAYFGFTDEELKRLDKWVRDNTLERFGPVRAVKPGLVLEVAFDALHRSARHKSGVAMRFPRVHRIRWDKPIEEADRLENLETLIQE